MYVSIGFEAMNASVCISVENSSQFLKIFYCGLFVLILAQRIEALSLNGSR